MQLWRVSRHRGLSGAGGLVVAGRWHSLGRRVVYASEHPATAQLEWLARLELSSPLDLPQTIPFSEIFVDDRASRSEIRRGDLPAGWERDEMITQQTGNEWLESSRSLLFYVPSVLVPARNILINPAHREAPYVNLTATFDFRVDERLLRRS